MKVPSTEEEWMEISSQFNLLWNFPNCIGALDGKHVHIIPPQNAGSYYYNYKHFHSIVLMALVDADLKFIYVDVGTNGRVSDGGVWKKTVLYEIFEKKSLNIPPPRPIFSDNKLIPYVVVADEAFGLKSYVMRPFPAKTLTRERRVFNYRLSRARRVVENAFGILSNRFQVLRCPMRLIPEKVGQVVLASCVLHNLLRSAATTRSMYTPMDFIDREDITTGEVLSGGWRSTPCTMSAIGSCSTNASADAYKIREEFTTYFNGVGAVPWQYNVFH
jgi:hypothetical protein